MFQKQNSGDVVTPKLTVPTAPKPTSGNFRDLSKLDHHSLLKVALTVTSGKKMILPTGGVNPDFTAFQALAGPDR